MTLTEAVTQGIITREKTEAQIKAAEEKIAPLREELDRIRESGNDWKGNTFAHEKVRPLNDRLSYLALEIKALEKAGL